MRETATEFEMQTQRPRSTYLATLAALPATALDRVLDNVRRAATLRALLKAVAAERAESTVSPSAASAFEVAVEESVVRLLRSTDVGNVLLSGMTDSVAVRSTKQAERGERWSDFCERLAMLAHAERMEMLCVASDDGEQSEAHAEKLPAVEGAQVWAAGRNDAGQGARRMVADVNALTVCAPQVSTAKGDALVMVFAGGRHSAALTARGKLFMCGANESGQLGVGDMVPRNSWVQVNGTLNQKCTETSAAGDCREPQYGRQKEPRVSMVACGRQHTLILLGDGRVLACGANDRGQCGVENKNDSVDGPICISDYYGSVDQHRASLSAILTPPARTTYFKAVSGFSVSDAEWQGGVVQVAVGFEHSVVLLGNGRVLSTGSNTRGQLGTRSHSGFRSHFALVDCYGHRIVRVACGADTTMMLTRNNMVLVTGKRATGLSVIGGLGSSRVSHLSVGDGFALCRTREGDVVISRHRKRFELSEEIHETISKSVSAGVKHYAVVTDEGTVLGCGFNAFGQVGAGQMGLTIQGGLDARIIRPHHVPLSRVAIPDGYRALQVASGAFHTLYLLAPIVQR